jgi:LacI family transcriptional regulator
MLTKRAPILKDVAQRAGVGIGTASVVVNGAPSSKSVSEETRRRILAAAAELNYTPNMIARGLTKQRHNTVGVTFHSQDPTWITADYYGISVLTGIIEGAYQAGYSTNLFHKRWQDAEHSAASFRGQAIDGFLVVAPGSDSDIVTGLAALGIPIVVISSSCDQHHVPSVDVDNVRGARLAVEHLLGLGHRRIGLLTAHTEQFDIAVRGDTYREVLAAAGVPIRPEWIQVMRGDVTGRAEARRLLTAPERPTAVFATDDGLAVAVTEVARELGIAVPRELSVVGFDDNPIGRHSSPPLTTIRQPLTPMAEEAARMLIALIEGRDVPAATQLFEPELVERGSTASPSA